MTRLRLSGLGVVRDSDWEGRMLARASREERELADRLAAIDDLRAETQRAVDIANGIVREANRIGTSEARDEALDALRIANATLVDWASLLSTAREAVQDGINAGEVEATDFPAYVRPGARTFGIGPVAQLQGLGFIPAAAAIWIAVILVAGATVVGLATVLSKYSPNLAAALVRLREGEERIRQLADVHDRQQQNAKERGEPPPPPTAPPPTEPPTPSDGTFDKALSFGTVAVVGVLAFVLLNSFRKG